MQYKEQSINKKYETGRAYKRRSKREVGTKGEQFAGQYLQELGYQILEYNYRCKKGEIDLIARDGDCLVFCEVKYRKNSGSGTPLEAVDIYKQRTLSSCALYYLMEHKLMDTACRFDVIGIEGENEKLWEEEPGDVKVTLVKNAFDYVG